MKTTYLNASIEMLKRNVRFVPIRNFATAYGKSFRLNTAPAREEAGAALNLELITAMSRSLGNMGKLIWELR